MYTGHQLEAGTTANVCIRLQGCDSSSRVNHTLARGFLYFLLSSTNSLIIRVIHNQAHWLYNSKFDVLQRFNDDWFLVFEPQSLGDLKYVHIWHDNYGTDPSWYCKRVEVTDLRTNKKWHFIVERWFSILPEIKNIEHVIPVGHSRDWRTEVKNNVELTIRDQHLLASVFLR